MSDTLAQVGHDYGEWLLQTDATYLGDRRYDDRLPDISQGGLRAQRQALQGRAQRVQARGPLRGDDAVSAYYCSPPEQLRTLAEERLGERFDLRTFHDALLLGGALPLRALEKHVHQWIARRAGEAQA